MIDYLDSYDEFMSLPKEEYHEYDSSHIVYSSDNMFFCSDLVRKEVSCFVKYELSIDELLGSFLRQPLVWRSKHVDYINTLPNEIIFITLVPTYGTITIDVDQTDDGKRFWAYQIKYALYTKLSVYYYNVTTKEILEIKDMFAFDEIKQQYNIGGTEKSHQKQLIVITNKKLTGDQS